MSLRGYLLAIPAALIVLLTLTACSGSETAPKTPDSGNTDSGNTAGASEEPANLFKACTAITTDEVGAIMGHKVSSKATPGSGCQFDPVDDPTATSVGIVDGIGADVGGGIESAKAGSQSVIEGEPQDITGVGDSAYVLVGKSNQIGGDNLQAQAAVEIKGQYIVVTMTDFGDATAETMTKEATELIKLVASKV